MPSRHPRSSGFIASRTAGEDGPPRERLARAERITSGTEIRALFKRGKRMRSRYADVIYAASPVSHPRLGVVVPKYRHDAVARNRVKRRLREIGRRDLLPRLRAEGHVLDVLVRARPEAYGAAFADLEEALGRLLERLR